MSPVFLDSSGVIALLHSKDPHHARAKELAEKFSGERRQRITTTAILTELGDGFARKNQWHIIAAFLAAVLRDPLVEIVPLDRDLARRAIDFREARPDKDWGLTDCVSFVVMADHGLQEAFTADHHFQQAGFRALLSEPVSSER
jgi:uncharacterized protein